MAFGFIKKTWKDRISEYPTRRTLTKEDGSTELVTVSRSEGTVSQEGDAYCADNMNDLEKRVDDALNEANSNLDNKYKFVTLSEKISGEGTVHELSESITNFRYLLFELVATNISYNLIMQSLIIPVEQFKGNILNKVAFELYITQRDYCHIGYTSDTRVTVVANNNTNIGVTILGIK